MSKFLTPLRYELIESTDELYVLTEPLIYQSDLLELTVTVPKGFVTDGPSVPRLPFVYLILGNRCKEAAVLHDWLYAWQGVERKLADMALREACRVSGIPEWITSAYFLGVRIGGWKAWNEDKISQLKWRAT